MLESNSKKKAEKTGESHCWTHSQKKGQLYEKSLSSIPVGLCCRTKTSAKLEALWKNLLSMNPLGLSQHCHALCDTLGETSATNGARSQDAISARKTLCGSLTPRALRNLIPGGPAQKLDAIAILAVPSASLSSTPSLRVSLLFLSLGLR